VEDNYVYLHNGLKVPISGPFAYCGTFSSVLAINRGVHEPLEEFVFQEALNRLPTSPVMLELGAYWGHYSMWLKVARPGSTVHLIEPVLKNLNAGKHNFALNGFTGQFMQSFVGKDQFVVDRYLAEKGIKKLDILHSDIQGYELEMLEGCSESLAANAIDRIFVSTHSQQLHLDVIKQLEKFNYRIEVSSDYDSGTTSFDGFIFASNRSTGRLFKEFTPMSRVQIESTSPTLVIDYLTEVMQTIETRKPLNNNCN